MDPSTIPAPLWHFPLIKFRPLETATLVEIPPNPTPTKLRRIPLPSPPYLVPDEPQGTRDRPSAREGLEWSAQGSCGFAPRLRRRPWRPRSRWGLEARFPLRNRWTAAVSFLPGAFSDSFGWFLCWFGDSASVVWGDRVEGCCRASSVSCLGLLIGAS